MHLTRPGRALRPAPRKFASERFNFADAEDNRLEPREMIFARGVVHFFLSYYENLTLLLYRQPSAASRSSDAAPPLEGRHRHFSRYERADYGSTADAGALAGVDAGAEAPSVQVPVLGLYSS